MKEIESGCIGKHRFDNQQTAKKVGKKFGKRHEVAHCVYRCANCAGWHIGNKIPGKKLLNTKSKTGNNF